MNYSDQINETKAFLLDKGINKPSIGIVLGTGLGKFADHIKILKSFSYEEIPNFPHATVEFHKGKFIYGTIGETYVLAMQGRFHYYEGYTMQQITFPIRVMHALGVSKLLLSNAAGGINKEYKKGDLILLDDHINLQAENPLRGLNSMEYGPRFPDMSCPYDNGIGENIIKIAEKHGVGIKKGVYASVCGPNLETRAEYRFLRTIGADMVGMSTVPEVIVANQLSMPCAAISVITDECDPENLQPVDISEIIAVAGQADVKLSAIFAEVVEAI